MYALLPPCVMSLTAVSPTSASYCCVLSLTMPSASMSRPPKSCSPLPLQFGLAQRSFIDFALPRRQLIHEYKPGCSVVREMLVQQFLIKVLPTRLLDFLGIFLELLPILCALDFKTWFCSQAKFGQCLSSSRLIGKFTNSPNIETDQGAAGLGLIPPAIVKYQPHLCVHRYCIRKLSALVAT